MRIQFNHNTERLILSREPTIAVGPAKEKRSMIDTNEPAPTIIGHDPASFSEEPRRQCSVSAMNTKAKPIILDIGPG